MKAKAIFTGANGSMGFEFGKVYELTITKWTDKGVQVISPKVIPYESKRAFNRNWGNVTFQ